MLAIDFPPELNDRLASAAERTGRTPTEVVREALIDHLDELEDLAGAEQALQEIRAGRSPIYSLVTVEREL